MAIISRFPHDKTYFEVARHGPVVKTLDLPNSTWENRVRIPVVAPNRQPRCGGGGGDARLPIPTSGKWGGLREKGHLAVQLGQIAISCSDPDWDESKGEQDLVQILVSTPSPQPPSNNVLKPVSTPCKWSRLNHCAKYHPLRCEVSQRVNQYLFLSVNYM